MDKKDEWEIAYINTKINDVYNPLNNNVDWLSTRIDLLQQDLDTIRKKDQQPATSIDICTITSIDSKFAAMEDRLQTYEDMHDRFTSPIVRYLDTLSTQMMNVQRDIGTLNDQHNFQEECSTLINRFRRAKLDVKKPTEHLPYTAAEVDQITSKLYTAIGTIEDRFEKRCDDIYFPFDVRLSGLDSHVEWLQKEVKAIQRQFASQHQLSASIDRERSKSIDSKAPALTDKHLVASIDTTSTPDAEQLIQKKMESMHEELNELSAYAYDKIGWHQFCIENTQERLQNISKAIHKMDERWTRNVEATRKKKDEWEIAYINTKINDVYNPLNNNVDWLSTRIDLLQQDLDTIRKKDQQPATSIDICTITSIDSKFAAMEDRLQTYEDMHDRFTSPIMRYLDTLSTQMMNVQRDIGTLNDQHDFQEECSTSIDRFRRASLDVKKPTEHLPYTAAEVDQITSKLYTAIDTMEDRFEKRCDDIYFPFDVRLSGLDSHAEWLQEGSQSHSEAIRISTPDISIDRQRTLQIDQQ
ncbi:hypothetical protein F2Q68_00003719 [Brassica cretica]|uniref:Uncharacterized protein n=1 Tax=Brassica cretica TaxID=69181 RepID=A0A8S9JPA2_BRACR|nr:hypothetical protein F2Q68_00003719 [Brassica cretica]